MKQPRRCGGHNKHSVESLANDLESLTHEDLSERDFRAKDQGHAGDGLLCLLWPNLEHWLADSDLRQSDVAYRAMQEAEMIALVRLLRSGAPDEELARITFLRRS